MNKRPLCAACILLLLVLALGKLLGFDYLDQGLPADRIRACMQRQETQEICGRVADFQEKEKSIQYILEDTVLFDSEQQIPLKTFLVYTEKENIFEIGDTVRLSGELEEILPPSNPGMFDARTYYGVQGIGYRCFAGEIRREQGAARTFPERVRQAMRKAREAAAENLKRAAGKYAGVLQAMALGDKNGLEDETKSSFQQGGVLHILTISGLHITLIGMGLLKLLMRAGCPLKAAAPVSLAVLILYGVFIGMGSSCVRAILMFCAALLAKLIKRTYDLPSALSLAAILMLLDNPAYLFYSGFQLSFGSVACAGILLPAWEGKAKKERPRRKKRRALTDSPLFGKTCGAVNAGFWLWLFLAPLCAYHFSETAPAGILMNLLILPALPALLLSALAASAAGFVSLTAAKLCALPGVLTLKLMDAALAAGQKLPGSVWITGQPAAWKMVLIYGGILALLYVRTRAAKQQPAVRYITSAAAVFATLLLLAPRSPGGLQITMLDVGQGDCLVIRTEGGADFMIDGGSTTENEVGYYRILPYLKSQGISRLDGVFLTHPDADHMNGILELTEQIAAKQTALSVDTLYLPAWMKGGEEEGELLASSRAAGISVQYLQKGMTLQSGKLCLVVLHPDQADYRSDPNAGSITLSLTYKGFTGLFTGDLQGEGEALVQAQAGKCDLLKVAHHGSNNSTPEEFLEITSPKISFLSYGADNTYGHPHPELVKRLKDCGSRIYETAKCGAVTVVTDGEEIKVKKYLTTVEK